MAGPLPARHRARLDPPGHAQSLPRRLRPGQPRRLSSTNDELPYVQTPLSLFAVGVSMTRPELASPSAAAVRAGGEERTVAKRGEVRQIARALYCLLDLPAT